jgi:hypothetical protein
MYELLNVNGKHETLIACTIHAAIEEAFKKASVGEWYLVDKATMVACLHFFI